MTELIWDGKYNKDGRRVAPLRVAPAIATSVLAGRPLWWVALGAQQIGR